MQTCEMQVDQKLERLRQTEISLEKKIERERAEVCKIYLFFALLNLLSS